MHRATILPVLFVLLTAACSHHAGGAPGTPAGAGASGGTGASSGTGASTGAGASGGSAGTGASGSTGASTGTGASAGTGASSGSSGSTGTGGSLPAVTLTMDTFTVPSGGEVYYCQDYANPFGGVDTDIAEFESHMSTGSHHLLLFYKPGVGDVPLAACSGLEFAATPYGSQTQDDSLSFPTGIAALLPGTMGLRIQSHYLNTTPNPVTAHVEVILHPTPAAAVQNQAAVLFVVDPNIDVMPNSSAVVSDDCTLPQDMYLLRTSSHMHQHGTSFVATIAGSTVYQTTTWSDPKPEAWSPPKLVHAGDPLHFACSFTNPSSSTLTFGESAQTNEMCIFTASFYPAPLGTATIDASNCVTSQK
jgi:hypothetical protein